MISELKLKSIFQLAWPAIVSQATITAVGIIDIIFIGQISVGAIAAVSIANSFITSLYYFLEGIRTGTTVITANYLGAQEKNNIAKTLKLSLAYAVIIGVIIAIFARPISRGIYALFAANDISKEWVEKYISIILVGAPFTLIFFAISGFFRGLKNTFIPFVITLGIFFTNVIFDYLLVNGFHGFPQMGVKGAAAGSLIAYIVGAILSIIFLVKHKLTRQFVTIKVRLTKLLKEYSRVAFEIGFYTGMLTLAILLFVFMIKHLGAQAIAVHEISHQVFLISFLAPYGFQIATSILVGKFLGSDRKDLILPVTKKIMFLCFIIVFIMTALTYIFAYPIAKLFNPTDPYVINLTTITIKLVCLEQLFSPISLVTRGALTGLKDTGFIVIAGLVTGYLFFLPLAYFLSITMNTGVIGGYIAFVLWSALDALVFWWRLFVTKKWVKYNI